MSKFCLYTKTDNWIVGDDYETVWAIKTEKSGYVSTSSGNVHYEKGDYIVYGKNGDDAPKVLKGDVFMDHYKPFKDEKHSSRMSK